MPNTKNKLNTDAFTLVELIVVIVILAILATIAFLSFSSQSGSARDSTRLSDISSIKKGMEMYNVGSGLYPSPDNPTSFTYSGGAIWNQGTLGDKAYKLIQKTLSKKVKDPLKNSEYDYSLASNKKEYQVAGNFENPTSFEKTYNPFGSDFLISQFSILNSPNANALGGTGANVYISGNYNGVLLKVFTGSTYYFVPTPTLFGLNANGTGNVVYDNTFGSGKDILPGVNNVAIFDSSKVYSTGSDNLGITDITDLMTTIKAAYLTGNVTTPAVQTIVNASGAGLIDIGNGLVKNSLGLGSAEINSSVSETIDIKIVGDDTSGRNWSNGTYASNCNGYKNPPTGKSYTGSTGNGQYWIKPGAVAIKVICEMTTSSGGWTKVNNLSDTEVNLILGGSGKQLVKCSDTGSEYILSPNLSGYTWSSSIKTKVGGTWNISGTDQSCGTDSEFDAASFGWGFGCSNGGGTENKFYPGMCEAGWPGNCGKWQGHTNSTFNICGSGNYASYSVFVR